MITKSKRSQTASAPTGASRLPVAVVPMAVRSILRTRGTRRDEMENHTMKDMSRAEQDEYLRTLYDAATPHQQAIVREVLERVISQQGDH